MMADVLPNGRSLRRTAGASYEINVQEPADVIQRIGSHLAFPCGPGGLLRIIRRHEVVAAEVGAVHEDIPEIAGPAVPPHLIGCGQADLRPSQDLDRFAVADVDPTHVGPPSRPGPLLL